MDEARRWASWWNHQARFTLQPTTRIEITDRTKSPQRPDGARCPWCGGELIAWLYGDNPEPPEVLCKTPDQHTQGEPARWERQEWARLGVLTGVRDDARFTTLRGQAATG